MEIVHWLMIAALILASLIMVKTLWKKSKLGESPCSVKRAYCDNERRKFWSSLQQAVGEDYVVLANVPLATMLTPEDERNEALQDWLNQHWADFAVLHESLFMPVAIVQFERNGEEEDPLWARGRDGTLQKVMDQAGLTLLWLPSEQYQHVELLRHALEQARGHGEVAGTCSAPASGGRGISL